MTMTTMTKTIAKQGAAVEWLHFKTQSNRRRRNRRRGLFVLVAMCPISFEVTGNWANRFALIADRDDSEYHVFSYPFAEWIVSRVTDAARRYRWSTFVVDSFHAVLISIAILLWTCWWHRILKCALISHHRAETTFDPTNSKLLDHSAELQEKRINRRKTIQRERHWNSSNTSCHRIDASTISAWKRSSHDQ